MKEPLVSIVMTNYNHDNFVKESIEAVLNQTYRNFQLIIIDDGSTDRSPEVIGSIEDERIEFYSRKENVHISEATNDAMEYVKGEYVAIADSDDIWLADKLEKQMKYLLEHPEYDACFTWVDIIDENGTDVNEKEKDVRDIFNASTDTQEEWLRFFFYIGNRLSNPTSVVSVKALKDIGKHNPAFVQGHDFDWWVRFTKKYRFAVLEEPLMLYRRYIYADQTNTSARNTENDIRFYNEYMMIRRHFFEDMDKEVFLRAFSSEFQNADSATDTELECEKAFLLCKPFNGASGCPACGLDYLEELLNDRESAKVLKEKFHFTQKDYYKLNGVSVYMDAYSQKQAAQYQVIRDENTHLKKVTADLNVMLEGKKKENDHLTELMDALKLQKAELEAELCRHMQEVNSLQGTIENMKNSISWRITRPIRGIKKILKSGDVKDEK